MSFIRTTEGRQVRVPSRMEQLPWFHGAPPSVGWWPASKMGDPTILRWWDGKVWSKAVSCYWLDAAFIEEQAAVPSAIQDNIYWSYRWWEAR